MADFKFETHSKECKETLNNIGVQWLNECGQCLLDQIQDIYRVDTGKTKNSFYYKVNESELSCTIGSPQENAIWEEFGTGIYAENGNGRKDPWSYKDVKGNWHRTSGKKGTSAFRRSFEIKKNFLIDRLENLVKGLR